VSTIVIQTNAKDIRRLLNRRFKRTPMSVNKGIGLAAHRARAVLVAATPVDRGEAKRGWRVEKQGQAGPLDRWVVTNPVPYIGVLELGRRPGRPVSVAGFLSIMEWVRRHKLHVGGTLGPAREGRKSKTYTVHAYGMVFRGREANIARIAQNICDKIKAHGQPGKFFVRNAMPQVQAGLAQEIKRAVEQDALAQNRGHKGGKGGR